MFNTSLLKVMGRDGSDPEYLQDWWPRYLRGLSAHPGDGNGEPEQPGDGEGRAVF